MNNTTPQPAIGLLKFVRKRLDELESEDDNATWALHRYERMTLSAIERSDLLQAHEQAENRPVQDLPDCLSSVGAIAEAQGEG